MNSGNGLKIEDNIKPINPKAHAKPTPVNQFGQIENHNCTKKSKDHNFNITDWLAST